MNKYIKFLSVILVLTSSIYLPSANAASTSSSTDMLITIAESNPTLIERLDDIAITDPELLNQLLKMADSDAKQLERLLNLAENNHYIFSKLANIKSVETTKEKKLFTTYGQAVTLGAIDHGTVIRN